MTSPLQSTALYLTPLPLPSPPQYEVSGFEKMPLLEALNGYKLKLPSEGHDEDTPTAEGEGGRDEEGEQETEGEGTRVANGAPAGGTASP